MILRAFLYCFGLTFLGGLAGCSYLPSAGPVSSEIESQEQSSDPSADAAEFGYRVVNLDAAATSILASYRPLGFRNRFSIAAWRPGASTIGTGDVLSVVVWEPDQNGLFARGGVGRAEIGPFIVGQSGTINVPYVGQVQARGRSPEALQRAITRSLSDKAVDPQVIVTIKERRSTLVSVSGDVRKPGRFPIPDRGQRVTDAIAQAGGHAHIANETFVTLVRGGRKGTMLLKSLIDHPGENIFLKPQDQLFVTYDPPTFTAFGAVPKVGEYPFGNDRLTLIEGLGRAGGLSDERADSMGLFVFRLERPDVARALLGDDVQIGEERVPIIYRVRMRDPKAYFFAQSFEMRDKDVIYVANSIGTELAKFIGILNAGLTTSSTVTGIGN